MKKRSVNFGLFFVVIVILMLIPVSSANIFSDFFGKITGRATSDTTALNITVGNSAPTISLVEAIAAKDPVIGSTRAIIFNFTATDSDGAGNINTSTAAGYFQRAGETTRSNTSCSSWASAGNNANFTCTIDMWYFDQNGAWTVNVTIRDINSATGTNSSTTFTYNLLTAMNMSPSSLTWTSVGLTSTDTGSNNDPVQINNTGNDVGLNINVTALSLRGEVTLTQFIYANNFTISNVTEGCSGTTMVNATSTNVTSALLYRGNNTWNYNNDTSGQEQIYFCLKGVPQDISAQSYSSSAAGPWTVAVVT